MAVGGEREAVAGDPLEHGGGGDDGQEGVAAGAQRETVVAAAAAGSSQGYAVELDAPLPTRARHRQRGRAAGAQVRRLDADDAARIAQAQGAVDVQAGEPGVTDTVAGDGDSVRGADGEPLHPDVVGEHHRGTARGAQQRPLAGGQRCLAFDQERGAASHQPLMRPQADAAVETARGAVAAKDVDGVAGVGGALGAGEAVEGGHHRAVAVGCRGVVDVPDPRRSGGLALVDGAPRRRPCEHGREQDRGADRPREGSGAHGLRRGDLRGRRRELRSSMTAAFASRGYQSACAAGVTCVTMRQPVSGGRSPAASSARARRTRARTSSSAPRRAPPPRPTPTPA